MLVIKDEDCAVVFQCVLRRCLFAGFFLVLFVVNILWFKRRFYSIEILNYWCHIQPNTQFETILLAIVAGACKMHIIKMANLITEPMLSSCISMTNSRCHCSRYSAAHSCILSIIFIWLAITESNQTKPNRNETNHHYLYHIDCKRSDEHRIQGWKLWNSQNSNQ